MKLQSKIEFSKKIAISYAKPSYYKMMGEYIRILPKIEKEKFKRSTPRRKEITDRIQKIKDDFEKTKQMILEIIKKIYEKNRRHEENGLTPPIHTNIFSLVANVPVLLISYKRIKPNKGATTLGAMLTTHKLKRLNPLQKKLLEKTKKSPDGITLETFKIAVQLLKEGKYPWGASRRIYIEKPGQPGKLRPITIPPFMDRIIQTAILLILESIDEPWFEIKNVSFGFKGVHDAIYSLIRRENSGLHTAIEGDIESAYPSLNKEMFINILRKRICDRKFLKLMEKRLDYIFYDSVKKEYIKEIKGLPQGGIDSPYIWNIYMNEFDEHITEFLENYLEQINLKVRKDNSSRFIIPKEVNKIRYQRNSLKETLKLTKIISYENFLQEKEKNKSSSIIVRLNNLFKKYKEDLIKTEKDLMLPKQVQFNLIKEIRLKRHEILKFPHLDQNKKKLRFVYARYADDWIILGNFSKILAEKIKSHIKYWLKENLDLKLSEEKTLITDFRNKETPAHFLGFEIRTGKERKLAYIKRNEKKFLARTAGSSIKAYPDRQRLINRLHMKGFCNKNGKPLSMKWLSTLETFAIIERFNAIMLGFGNFYHGFVYKSTLNRWIYIIKFCALLTIAQKYNCSIKKIYTKFGIKQGKHKSIEYIVTNIFESDLERKIMAKSWILLSEKEIQSKSLAIGRYKTVKKNFEEIHYYRRIPEYKHIVGDKKYSIKDENWIEKTHWVNLRTKSSFDLPCGLCGSNKEIHMHHIRHIRKTKYTKLTKEKPWLKIMFLRNRKQIPVCANCHIRIIHRGKYNKEKLAHLASIGTDTFRGYENRLINIENYINPSNIEYNAESLEEKGWSDLEQEQE